MINQGLYYIDWLMDHKAEFKLLVLERFGKSQAELIDWSEPRLICIAANFTKYDAHAIQRMSGSVELIRYKKFGSDLFLLELVKAVSANWNWVGMQKPRTAAKAIRGQRQGYEGSPDKNSGLPRRTRRLKRRILFKKER